MDSNLAISVGRLSGYLNGVVAVDGDIREYTAGAFLLSGKSADSPEALVREFYAAQTDLQFSISKKLDRGLGGLEQHLGGYLLRRPWRLVEQTIPQQSLNARQAFLAFRIMDMISDMAPEARTLRSVYMMETVVSSSQSSVTFFCVEINAGFLVLQFNDDSAFIRAHGA